MHLKRWLGQEVLFGVQYLVHVLLKIGSKSRRYLVKAPNQSVAICRILLSSWWLWFRWSWAKHAFLNTIINIKPINTTCYSFLTSIKRLYGQVEEVTNQLPGRRRRIKSRELYAFNAFGKITLHHVLIHNVLNGACMNLFHGLFGSNQKPAWFIFMCCGWLFVLLGIFTLLLRYWLISGYILLLLISFNHLKEIFVKLSLFLFCLLSELFK